MRRRPPHTRGDSGAAAVEFAMLFPIFMVLALGTISAGIAFSKQINVTQAAREASRYGATYDIKTIAPPSGQTQTQVWLKAVDDALIASAGEAASPIAGYDYRCVAYVKTKATAGGGVDTGSMYRKNGGAATAGQCPEAPPSAITAIQNTDYVQVLLSRKTNFFILFANPELTLDAVSLTPYEGRIP